MCYVGDDACRSPFCPFFISSSREGGTDMRVLLFFVATHTTRVAVIYSGESFDPSHIMWNRHYVSVPSPRWIRKETHTKNEKKK